MTHLIVYKNVDEVIVTTLDRESETIKMYFTEGGRELEDWDRREYSDCAIDISPKLCIG